MTDIICGATDIGGRYGFESLSARQGQSPEENGPDFVEKS